MQWLERTSLRRYISHTDDGQVMPVHLFEFKSMENLWKSYRLMYILITVATRTSNFPSGDVPQRQEPNKTFESLYI